MSDLRMMATTLWTQLLEGLRADGLIAHCVQQSGPATTQVLVSAVTMMQAQQQPWLGPHIKPQPGKEAVAILNSGRLIVLKFNDSADSHGLCWWNDEDGRCYPDTSIRCYTFIDTTGAPQ